MVNLRPCIRLELKSICFCEHETMDNCEEFVVAREKKIGGTMSTESEEILSNFSFVNQEVQISGTSLSN